MIARTWKGWTSKENADQYEALFLNSILPKVTDGINGFKGVNLLKNEQGAEVEFTTIFWFDSFQAVVEFAGSDYHKVTWPNGVGHLS